jgi:hypothetical protein
LLCRRSGITGNHLTFLDIFGAYEAALWYKTKTKTKTKTETETKTETGAPGHGGGSDCGGGEDDEDDNDQLYIACVDSESGGYGGGVEAGLSFPQFALAVREIARLVHPPSMLATGASRDGRFDAGVYGGIDGGGGDDDDLDDDGRSCIAADIRSIHLLCVKNLLPAAASASQSQSHRHGDRSGGGGIASADDSDASTARLFSRPVLQFVKRRAVGLTHIFTRHANPAKPVNRAHTPAHEDSRGLGHGYSSRSSSSSSSSRAKPYLHLAPEQLMTWVSEWGSG